MAHPSDTKTTPKIAIDSGERLARLRRERGITQAEFAERLGLAQPASSANDADP